MAFQIAYGTMMILLSTLVAAVGFFLLELALIRGRGWLSRPPLCGEDRHVVGDVCVLDAGHRHGFGLDLGFCILCVGPF